MTNDLPNEEIDGRAIRRRIIQLAAFGGTSSGFLVLGVFALGARLTPEQVPFILKVVVSLTVSGILVSIPVYARLLGPILEYLGARETDPRIDTLRHKAFTSVLSCPRYMVIFGYSYYPTCALILSGLCILRFEDFDRTMAGLMILCASGMGFPSEMALYVPFRRTLEPVRNKLAMEIQDATIRNEIAPFFSLPRKIAIAMISLAFIAVIVMSSLVQLRAKQTMEAVLLENHEKILQHVAQTYAETGDLVATLEFARQNYGRPLGIDFSLLDVDGREVLDAGASAWLPSELEYVQGMPAGGSSIEISVPHVFAWTTLSERAGIVTASIPRDRVNARVHTARGLIVIFGGAICLISMITTWFFARDLKRAFSILQDHVQRVARGDLTRTGIFESEDELGRLGRAMDVMSASLRETVMRVTETVERVDQAAGDISSVAQDVSAVTTDQIQGISHAAEAMGSVTLRVDSIADSTRGLTTAVEESSSAASEIKTVGASLNQSGGALSKTVSESEAAIDEMMGRFKEVSQKTEELTLAVGEAMTGVGELAQQISQIESSASEMARLSDTVTDAADKGTDRVNQTILGMHAISHATETAQEEMQALGARVDDIGHIVNVIDDVADETNLLALNAAIISAQAGEHGRAFAVVSDEIKELADRVATSTNEISQLIRGLQEQSGNVIQVIEEGVVHVQSGVQLSNEAGAALKDITFFAEESGRQVEVIVRSVHEHRGSARHVAELMERVGGDAESIQEASEAQVEGAVIVRTAADAVGQMTRQVRTTTEEQERSTGFIARNLEEVRNSVTGIHSALESQQEDCRHTEESLESLRQRTRANEKATARMGNAMKAMLLQAETLRRDIRRFRV